MISDVLLLLALILLNGMFAMSEIAIVSARRARLAQLADAGRAGARQAIALASEPTRFLSAVQVGITTIGILSGAIGEASVAGRIQTALEAASIPPEVAQPGSLGIMVLLLTYVSLILGELVPKRLALTHPESIAAMVARPMDMLARLGRPVVKLLSASTDGILRLFGVRQTRLSGITADEIRLMLEQGAEEGVFEATEHEMVSNVLNLDERQVGSVLTPRSEVVFLDVRDTFDRNREKLRENQHAVLPLCDGGLDQVLGVVRSSAVLNMLADGREVDLQGVAGPALFVPETMTLMRLLEQFKRARLPIALVINEFGGVEGLVSLTDVVTSIVGDLPAEADEEPMVVLRDDGSWLMDGALDLDAVIRTLETESIATEADRQQYHTLGGLAMIALGRVPKTGDVFERAGLRFEVVDMDGHRVDRVLVSRVPEG